MNIEEFRDYCLAKRGVTEETPFGPDTLVFKVMGKMFALTGITDFEFINLKSDPKTAIQLREQYDGVKPGYHMSKTHWNSVSMDGTIDENIVKQWIDDSYNIVADSLKKKDKEFLNNL